MTSILQDILDPELLEQYKLKAIQVAEVGITSAPPGAYSRSAVPSKNLSEFYELVKIAVQESEKREGRVDRDKTTFREEEPDLKAIFPAITFELIRRQPGAFGGGAPFESRVKNQTAMFREEVQDPDNPGYKIITAGYFYDNVIRFN